MALLDSMLDHVMVPYLVYLWVLQMETLLVHHLVQMMVTTKELTLVLQMDSLKVNDSVHCLDHWLALSLVPWLVAVVAFA